MIVKTGIDIIEVSRIEESIKKFGNSFLNRIYTEKEIEYCESKNVQKFQSYAGRFAAKEAIFKCVSELLDSKFDIEWKDIEILNDKNGRPFVMFHGNLEKKLFRDISVCDILDKDSNHNCNTKAEFQIDLSISHINNVAVASAVIQMEGK